MNDTTQPSTAVAVVKPGPVNVMAGGAIRALIPQSFDEAWRVANAAFVGGICPRDCTTAENAMVRVLHGLEVGLPPMQAIQSIAVINGRPTIWGDAAIALVIASGQSTKIKEWEELRDGVPTAVCMTIRKGDTEPVERTWSQADEITAGLASKDIHKAYPKRMRQMRARAFLLRDVYADILKGLGIREEVEDYQEPQQGRLAPPTPPQLPPTPPAPPPVEAEVVTTVTIAQEPEVAEASGDRMTEEELLQGLEVYMPDGGAPGEEIPLEDLSHLVQTQSTPPGPPPETEAKTEPAKPKPVRRQNGKSLTGSDQTWIDELRIAYAACKDMLELGAAQVKHCMRDGQKLIDLGAVTPAAWTQANALLQTEMVRLSSKS